MNNKKPDNYGQFFTNELIVKDMIKLIKNNGSVLEPSCGDGVFLNYLVGRKNVKENIKEITAIEIDEDVIPKVSNFQGFSINKKISIINNDFLDYDIENKYDTIIGNPPYVKYKEMLSSTKNIIESFKPINFDIFDKRTNLYMFFIYKAFLHLKDHGELIFIVPREFLNSTAAEKMNSILYKNGTMTDVWDYGDSKIFNNAQPNCIVFRYEKGNFSRITNFKKIKWRYERNQRNMQNNNVIQEVLEENKRCFFENNGKIYFLKNFKNFKNFEKDSESEQRISFSDLFFVKVGGVSGADKYFDNNDGNIEMVYSKTCQTGKLKKMIYNIPHKDLIPFKNILINRKIKKFDENTWYMWGRDFYHSDQERIYVNAKTRCNTPFFYNECKNYDGSVLAIFPKFPADKNVCQKICKMFNEVDWDELGFVCDDRFQFSQKALESTILPFTFNIFLKPDI